MFAILQKYDFSSKSQRSTAICALPCCCLRYCKSTIFQANHNAPSSSGNSCALFAILQKYDFSSKSQPSARSVTTGLSCLRYCKSTIFQANHNSSTASSTHMRVVCDTAKVRFFKQITTAGKVGGTESALFAILQKYDFSSKSQLPCSTIALVSSCLRYCKSTIFQANHNQRTTIKELMLVVCDTAKVRFFKQITTNLS